MRNRLALLDGVETSESKMVLPSLFPSGIVVVITLWYPKIIPPQKSASRT